MIFFKHQQTSVPHVYLSNHHLPPRTSTKGTTTYCDWFLILRTWIAIGNNHHRRLLVVNPQLVLPKQSYLNDEATITIIFTAEHNTSPQLALFQNLTTMIIAVHQSTNPTHNHTCSLHLIKEVLYWPFKVYYHLFWIKIQYKFMFICFIKINIICEQYYLLYCL